MNRRDFLNLATNAGMAAAAKNTSARAQKNAAECILDITAHFGSLPTLRFHPACYYRADDSAPLERWPTLLGAVTDLGGAITGRQRTWLAEDGGGKAPVDDPRRALGHLPGHAVRFGKPADVMAAGEGIETVLSLLSLFPALPMAAVLSAAHLAAILFPPSLRRFYHLRDNDAAGLFCGRAARRTRPRGGHRVPRAETRRQGSQCGPARRSGSGREGEADRAA